MGLILDSGANSLVSVCISEKSFGSRLGREGLGPQYSSRPSLHVLNVEVSSGICIANQIFVEDPDF